MSALGQKRTYAVQNVMSALPPIATAKADMPRGQMSALLPKADMCGATRDVRCGPIANPKLNCRVRKIVGKGFKCFNTFFRIQRALYRLYELVIEALICQENRAFGFHARNRCVDIARRGKYQLFHHVDLIAKGREGQGMTGGHRRPFRSPP